MIHKLFIIATASVLFLSFIGVAPVFADTPPNPLQEACDEIGDASPACLQSQSQGTTDPISGSGGVFYIATNLLSLVAGIAAVVFIIIGALGIITSGGDAQKAAVGRTRIINGLIGLAVVALSWALIQFVLGKIVGT
jgi:hypothetical protein